MRLIDISPALSAETPNWPGDTAFAAKRTWQICEGGSVNVSKITLSTHAGAHADAPLHYDSGGAPIDAVPLEPYIGLCAVIHLIGVRIVEKEDAAGALQRLGGAVPPRILIRTYDRQPSQAWDSNFPVVSAPFIHWLAEQGVMLIGVDAPSLDPEQSKTMDAHQAVLARDMRILEGLCLDDVEEGRYELIAPPLKLKGLDAAPVRAVLRAS